MPPGGTQVSRSQNRAPFGVRAAKLKVGDWIFDKQGKRAKVGSIRRSEIGERPSLYIDMMSYRPHKARGGLRGSHSRTVLYELNERVQRAVHSLP